MADVDKDELRSNEIGHQCGKSSIQEEADKPLDPRAEQQERVQLSNLEFGPRDRRERRPDLQIIQQLAAQKVQACEAQFQCWSLAPPASRNGASPKGIA